LIIFSIENFFVSGNVKTDQRFGIVSVGNDFLAFPDSVDKEKTYVKELSVATKVAQVENLPLLIPWICTTLITQVN